MLTRKMIEQSMEIFANLQLGLRHNGKRICMITIGSYDPWVATADINSLDDSTISDAIIESLKDEKMKVNVSAIKDTWVEVSEEDLQKLYDQIAAKKK